MEPQRRDREPAAQTLISRRVPQAPVTRSPLPTPQAAARPAQPTPNPRAGSLDATELESGEVSGGPQRVVFRVRENT